MWVISYVFTGRCPEDAKISHNECEVDIDCQPAMQMVRGGNGVRTGACVRSDIKPTQKVC